MTLLKIKNINIKESKNFKKRGDFITAVMNKFNLENMYNLEKKIPLEEWAVMNKFNL